MSSLELPVMRSAAAAEVAAAEVGGGAAAAAEVAAADVGGGAAAAEPAEPAVAAAAGGGAVVELVKLVLLGSANASKINLVRDIVDVGAVRPLVETIGIDFKTRVVSIDRGRTSYKLQVWDTAGQERFRSITTSYLKGAKGFFLVFDYNDRDSFKSIEMWNNYILASAGESVDAPKALIGYNHDVEHQEEQKQKIAFLSCFLPRHEKSPLVKSKVNDDVKRVILRYFECAQSQQTVTLEEAEAKASTLGLPLYQYPKGSTSSYELFKTFLTERVIPELGGTQLPAETTPFACDKVKNKKKSDKCVIM